MMKARSLAHLTPSESEATFNFSGKTALEILYFLLDPVLLRYSKSKVELIPNLSEFCGAQFSGR